MEQKDPTGVRPVVQRQQDYQERDSQKKFITSPRDRKEDDVEAAPRRPAPLPFGKIDVIA